MAVAGFWCVADDRFLLPVFYARRSVWRVVLRDLRPRTACGVGGALSRPRVLGLARARPPCVSALWLEFVVLLRLSPSLFEPGRLRGLTLSNGNVESAGDHWGTRRCVWVVCVCVVCVLSVCCASCATRPAPAIKFHTLYKFHTVDRMLHTVDQARIATL